MPAHTRLSNRSYFLPALLVLLAACQTDPDQYNRAKVEIGAHAFMLGYELDIQAGDRHAIGQRYDARGATRILGGKGKFLTKSEISQKYETDWTGPQFFAWRDLHYDVISADAILVTGQFQWLPATADDTLNFSYSGLLVKFVGTWGLRYENELLIRDSHN